jgi:hypothetical protein
VDQPESALQPLHALCAERSRAREIGAAVIGPPPVP